MQAISRPSLPRRGFTSFELVVTLALIGLVLALGVTRIDSSTWRLDSAGQDVVQHVRAARALAVLRQHDVVVIFDVEASAIVVHEDANRDGAIDAGERVRRQPLEGNVHFTRSAGPHFAGFTAGPVTFRNSSVTFRRNGSASEEGAIYLGRRGIEKARVVVIRRATGYAEMFRYNGSGWLSE
jgi:Tfp pilus assembly protein FimT